MKTPQPGLSFSTAFLSAAAAVALYAATVDAARDAAIHELDQALQQVAADPTAAAELQAALRPEHRPEHLRQRGSCLELLAQLPWTISAWATGTAESPPDGGSPWPDASVADVDLAIRSFNVALEELPSDPSGGRAATPVTPPAYLYFYGWNQLASWIVAATAFGLLLRARLFFFCARRAGSRVSRFALGAADDGARLQQLREALFDAAGLWFVRTAPGALCALGFLGTLVSLAATLEYATSPDRLPEVGVRLGSAFATSICSAIFALPLIFAVARTDAALQRMLDRVRERLDEAPKRDETCAVLPPDIAATATWMEALAELVARRLRDAGDDPQAGAQK